jgi:putative acetyltransferase
VLIESRTLDDPELRAMSIEQQRELAGIEGDTHISFPMHDDIDFLVGVIDGQAVACGALQYHGDGIGEVKRMYVLPHLRGQGLSRRVLTAVEALALDKGLHTLRLETATYLPAAIGLYTSSGYYEIPAFGQYVGHPTSVCFEKKVD